MPHLGSESRSPGPRASAGCCQFGQFLIIIADLEHGALGGAGVPRGSGSDHSPEATEVAGKRARFSVFLFYKLNCENVNILICKSADSVKITHIHHR